MGNGIPFLSCKGDPPKNDNTKVTLGLAKDKAKPRPSACAFREHWCGHFRGTFRGESQKGLEQGHPTLTGTLIVDIVGPNP